MTGEPSKVESTGGAMAMESADAATRAAYTATDREYVYNQVLTAAEQANAEAAIRVAQTGEVTQDSIDSFLSQIDPKSSERNAIKQNLDMLKSYIEKGQFSGNKAEFMKQIQQAIQAYPPLRDALGNPADMKRYTEWMLTNQGGTMSPEMFQRIEALFQEKPPITQADIKKLEATGKEKEAERHAAKYTRDEAEKDKNRWQAVVDDFKDKTKTGSKAEKLDIVSQPSEDAKRKGEYETAKKEEESAQANLDKLERELEQTQRHGSEQARRAPSLIDADRLKAEARIKALESITSGGGTLTPAEATELTDEKQRLIDLSNELVMSKRYGTSAGRRELAVIEADVSKAKSELDTKKKDRETKEALYKEKELLENEKKRAEEELQKATSALNAAETKLVTASGEKDTTDTAYQEALRKYKAWEKSMKDKSGRIINESAAAWINAEADRLEKAFDAHSKKMQEQGTTDKDKRKSDVRRKISEGLTDEKKKKVRGKEVKYRVTNKEKVFKNAQGLLDDGPDAFIEKYCASVGISDPEEIKSLKSDTAFKNDIISEVLGRHMISNGILPHQIEQIERSDWGNGMIQSALDKNESVKTALENALGAGVLQSGFWEKFWKVTKNNKWLLLFILSGVVTAGAVLAGPLGGAAGAGIAGGGITFEGIGIGQRARSMGTLQQLK